LLWLVDDSDGTFTKDRDYMYKEELTGEDKPDRVLAVLEV